VEDWVTGVELLDYNCNSWATKWEQGCNAMPWTHARRKSMQSRHIFDKTLVVMVGCHLIYTYIYMCIHIYIYIWFMFYFPSHTDCDITYGWYDTITYHTVQ
jgi:hypothetical protein